MAYIVSLLGSKGGSGKTTLSHMLCYGLGLLGHRAAYVMTDGGREAPRPGTLPYVYADGREAPARARIIQALKSREDWIGVVDGGANQMQTDDGLHAESDLVLLPFRDSAEDLRVVCRDLERMPHALALPSQWPSNPWQFKASVRLLESAPEPLHGRILAPVFALSASKQLLQDPLPESLPTALSSACRAVARYLVGLLELDGAPLPAERTALGAAARMTRVVAAREKAGA
ncbi:MAG: hypothetical protein REI09_09490 [Candidatus Dactylopiibacterium sp.]|nr:hypothetical protein [Candidatus Dactylopiibacterium sp.]